MERKQELMFLHKTTMRSVETKKSKRVKFSESLTSIVDTIVIPQREKTSDDEVLKNRPLLKLFEALTRKQTKIQTSSNINTSAFLVPAYSRIYVNDEIKICINSSQDSLKLETQPETNSDEETLTFEGSDFSISQKLANKPESIVANSS